MSCKHRSSQGDMTLKKQRHSSFLQKMNDSPTSVNTAGCNPSEAILHNLQCEPDLVHGLGIVLMVHCCHRLGDIGASDIGCLDSVVAVAQLEPAAC